MKKYTKQMRKRVTFLLLLAMLVTMVKPVCSYAAGDEPMGSYMADDILDPSEQESQDLEQNDKSARQEEKDTESGDGESGQEDIDLPEEFLDSEQKEDVSVPENEDENGNQPETQLYESEDSEKEVTINFYVLGENVDYVLSATQKLKVKTNQTLKDCGIEFPEMSSYDGLTQIGWMNYEGQDITEDTQATGYNMYLYAKYNKGVVQAGYQYPDKNGLWTTEIRPVTYEHGGTYGDAIKAAQSYIPQNIIDGYTFSNWSRPSITSPDPSLGSADSNTIAGVVSFRLQVKFSGFVSIHVMGKYYDQRGSYGCHGDKFFAMKEGSTYGEALNILTSDLPEMYPGLRFKEWDFPSSYDNKVLPENAAFKMKAVYENCLVRYLINPTEEEMFNALGGDGDSAAIFCQVAEKGETVNALTSFKGFGEVTWWEGKQYGLGVPPSSFVVNEDMTFCGDAEAVSNDSNGSDQSSKPSDSTSDSKDDSKLSDSVVNEIVQTIKNAASGESFRITMGTKTVISKEILEAAKGKNVTLILEMDGYTWTINGMDIQADRLQDIELRVIKNTNNIPAATVQAMAGIYPSMQITLAYNGSFGFNATLTLGVGTQYAGKYGNLFYHNNDRKMAFVDAGLIDTNGNVNLTFSHASDYLLVISDRIMSQADVPDDLMPEGAQGLSQNGSQAAANSNQSVKTGDYDMVLPWILLGVSALGAMVYMWKRKHA